MKSPLIHDALIILRSHMNKLKTSSVTWNVFLENTYMSWYYNPFCFLMVLLDWWPQFSTKIDNKSIFLICKLWKALEITCSSLYTWSVSTNFNRVEDQVNNLSCVLGNLVQHFSSVLKSILEKYHKGHFRRTVQFIRGHVKVFRNTRMTS